MKTFTSGSGGRFVALLERRLDGRGVDAPVVTRQQATDGDHHLLASAAVRLVTRQVTRQGELKRLADAEGEGQSSSQMASGNRG